MRVSIVDDDIHYSKLVSYRIGKRPDCDVEVFYSGEDFLDGRSAPPDFLLLDIMMPGIGGIETLRIVRQRYPELPVLVISAQGTHQTAAEAVQMGAYDYVTKGHDDLLRLDLILRNVSERYRLQKELADCLAGRTSGAT